MTSTHETRFIPVSLSLADLVGAEYIEAVCTARAALSGGGTGALLRAAHKPVDFFPASLQRRLRRLLPRVGQPLTAGLAKSAPGASSAAFKAATKPPLAPLSGLGYFRLTESGRLIFLSKSEHYHAPLGHAFPGYRLLEVARRLGIPNAAHNNTRGHITRLLETALVRAASGIDDDDTQGLARVMASRGMNVINRVLNLETGSLACEAALKMILARFYLPQPGCPEPKYAGRTPVMVVMGDDQGTVSGNYHGTTILTQMMRGLWSELYRDMARRNLFVVRPVRPNNEEDLARVFAEYDSGRFKIAGFFHEIVMMNYGGRRLTERFLRRAHALCRKHDVPTVVDEIQSCLWSPELFLFREYELKPSIVAVGKGFPGGEYAASRILFSAPLDCLPQFGALVTNGQEELASLAYLITMRWAQANADVTGAVGEYYESMLRVLAGMHGDVLCDIQGRRHLAALYFHKLDTAKAVAQRLNQAGLEISVQTYKDDCPPSALTKLPLIADKAAVDLVLDRIEQALREVS